MKRTDHIRVGEAIRRLHALAKPGTLTKEELAEQVFTEFPDAWELLTPALQAKWCWEKVKELNPPHQPPLFALGEAGVPQPRPKWSEELWLKQLNRLHKAGRACLNKFESLRADYVATFHHEPTLFDAADETPIR